MSEVLEREEQEELEAVAEYLNGTKEPPDSIRDQIELMRKIDINKLLSPVGNTDIATHILGILDGVKELIIRTENVEVQLRFVPYTNRSYICGFPISNGKRVYLRELLKKEPTTDLGSILV